MAIFLRKKIAAAFFLALALGTSACAKEEFVKYTEVKDKLEAKAPEKGAISTDELKALLDKKEPVVLFDARSKTEFEKERIAGAKLPRTDEYYRDQQMFQQQIIRQAPSSKAALLAGAGSLPHDTAIVAYCNKQCGLSKNLKLDLEGMGFKNVRWLDGGIDVWREKGFPIEKG